MLIRGIESYTGVQLLKVLLASGVGPILMIAFTNHALDHLLCSVLDTGVTNKIVRFGRSKATDERIAQFSMDHMEEVAGRSRLNNAFAGNYRDMRGVEEEIKKLMTELRKTSVDSVEISSHLEIAFPGHFQFINTMPQWVRVLYELERTEDGLGTWHTTGRGGRDQEVDTSLYAFWLAGHDLDFLERAHTSPRSAEVAPSTVPNATSDNRNRYDALAEDNSEDTDEALHAVPAEDEEITEDDDSDIDPEEAWKYVVIEDLVDSDAGDPEPVAAAHTQDVPVTAVPQVPDIARSTVIQPADFLDVNSFFLACGLPGAPSIPQQNRDLRLLLEDDCEDVWGYSKRERQRFHLFIEEEVRTMLQQTRITEFERLRQRYRDATRKYNEGKDEVSQVWQSFEHEGRNVCVDPPAASAERRYHRVHYYRCVS